MEGLHPFDHWNVSSREEVKKELERIPRLNGFARIMALTSLPTPYFRELRQWAVVHLLKQHQQGNTNQGFKTYRKVAELMQSSGNYTGNLMAISLLSNEHDFSQALTPSGWSLVPEDSLEAYRRVSSMWGHMLFNTWLYEFPAQFDPYLKPEMEVCATVPEFSYVLGLSGYQDFLEPRSPFETDFFVHLQRSREFQKNSFQCAT